MKILWNGKEVECYSAEFNETHLGETSLDGLTVRDLCVNRLAEFGFSGRHMPDIDALELGQVVRVQIPADSERECILPKSPDYWEGEIAHAVYSLPHLVISLCNLRSVVALKETG
jgi:hypothetical protein